MIRCFEFVNNGTVNWTIVKLMIHRPAIVMSAIILLLIIIPVNLFSSVPDFETAYRDQIRSRLIQIPSPQSVNTQWFYPFVRDAISYSNPATPRSSWDSAYWRKAVQHYIHSKELFEKLKSDLLSLNSQNYSITNGWFWQKEEEDDARRRKISIVKNKAYIKILEDYSFVHNSLAKIRSRNIREHRQFKNLTRIVLRNEIILSINIDDFDRSFQLLQEYKKSDGAIAEWPMHYYLARIYYHKLALARKNRSNSEEVLIDLRRKKNIHFLAMVELRYGKNSREFLYAKEKIRLDELGSPRSDT